MQAVPNHEPRATSHEPRGVRGVTLVELIMVIIITGIIGTAVAFFIQRPIEGYVDAARRAELTDIADTALRRMTRDLRTALPNSVRVDGTGKYIEYFQTSGGGRYRADKSSAGAGNPLDFTTADTAFDVIGPLPTLTGTESIVIYNLTTDSAITTANAYSGGNRGSNASVFGSGVSFTAPAPGTAFPFPSPGRRFQVVQYPVTYRCDLGTGQLRRYWNYTIQSSQPTPPTTPPGSEALLATNVSDCSFTYAPDSVTARTGVVKLFLKITEGGESVQLFQQVHVNNVP